MNLLPIDICEVMSIVDHTLYLRGGNSDSDSDEPEFLPRHLKDLPQTLPGERLIMTERLKTEVSDLIPDCKHLSGQLNISFSNWRQGIDLAIKHLDRDFNKLRSEDKKLYYTLILSQDWLSKIFSKIRQLMLKLSKV